MSPPDGGGGRRGGSERDGRSGRDGWDGWDAWRRRALALVPSRCAVCAGTASGGAVCPSCEADLRALTVESPCPRCGIDGSRGAECGECVRRPPPFDSTAAALRFDLPLDMLVTHFKFGGGWRLAEFLADLARSRLDLAALGDAAVAVPLHPRRERERGFNQSREIARRLCGKRSVPLMENWIARVVDTPQQTRMKDSGERRRNVRGAFAASPAARGKRVVVVDDVMTTGATLDEIARTLKRAGAKSVANAVLARAQRKI